ncbi:MAG: hypothetical protein FWE84_02365 [Firmicutes bacterium]|nr:hypothetical protein [Bacillota bacterium]
MPYNKEKKNCFDKFIFKTRVFQGVVVFILLGAVALILCGTVFFRDEHFPDFPNLALMVPGIFLAFMCLPALFVPWMLRHNTRVMHEKVKLFLSEDEIAEIERVSFLDTAILKKAQKLQKQGEKNGNMSEYNNFCQIVAMAGFTRAIMTQSISHIPPREGGNT